VKLQFDLDVSGLTLSEHVIQGVLELGAISLDDVASCVSTVAAG